MGVTVSEHSEVIAGTPADCMAALLDFGSYPEWQSAVKSADVLDGSGSPVVEFRIDAKLRTVRYVLRYHPEPPGRLWWEYVEGDVNSVAGEYRLEDLGGGSTRATYHLEIDPGRFVPGPLRRILTEGVMRLSVRELKARVEQAS